MCFIFLFKHIYNDIQLIANGPNGVFGKNVVSLVEEDLRQGQERNNTHNTTTIQKILWNYTNYPMAFPAVELISKQRSVTRRIVPVSCWNITTIIRANNKMSHTSVFLPQYSSSSIFRYHRWYRYSHRCCHCCHCLFSKSEV